MPFVPYTDEEIKTLKAKEGPRFVPYSDEELYNLKTEQLVKAQEWNDSVNSLYKKIQGDFNQRSSGMGPLPSVGQYKSAISKDINKLLNNYSYAEEYANQIQDQNERKSAERNSCDAGDNDHIADCLRRFFRLFSPQTEAVYGCQAVPQQAGQGNGDRSDRRDDVGRAIAEIADAVTDEYLVNDIIQ